MPAFDFTKAALENLPLVTSQYEARDRKTPGLILRVSPGGTKTFMYYRKVSGRPVRIKIGRFPELSIEQVRKKAAVISGQMMDGVRPQEILKVRIKEPTFRELFTKYYKEHLLVHTKRPEDNKATVEYHLIAKIGSKPLRDITRAMMKDVHLELGLSSGHGQSNRVLDIARAVFNFGLREELYSGKNPCTGIQRFKIKSRDRFLSRDELRAFFSALGQEEQIFQDFFQLSLFIGARKSTMLQMRFADIDLNRKRWRLSEEQSKNDDVNIFMLSDPAVEIIKRRIAAEQEAVVHSPFVFPGTGEAGHLKDPKKSWARIKTRMKVPDIRIHDLRRTLGSYMAITNASLPIIGKALNHKSQDATAIYARLSQDPILAAVNIAATAMN